MISKEQRAEIMSGCKFKPSHTSEEIHGGQQVAMSPKGVILTHPDFSVTIFMNEYRTQSENKAAAEAMFEFFLLSKNIK